MSLPSSRRQQLLDKLAASMPRPAPAAAAVARPFSVDAKSNLRDGVMSAIKGAPAAALAGIGGLATLMLGSKLKDHLAPKPSILKTVFARNGPLTHALGYGLGAAAIGGSVFGVKKLHEHATEPGKRDAAFKMMKTENPALGHDAHVRKSFDTLWRFNPDMAKDPLVAGTFVRRAMAFKDEGIQSQDVKTLTEVRKNLADAKSKKHGPFDDVLPTTAGDLRGFAPKD